MARIEGNQLIIEMGEGEARLAARLLPLLAPMLDFFLKVFTRILLKMALLGKEKLKELMDKMEAGEEGVLQSTLFPEPESFQAFVKDMGSSLDDALKLEDINRILGSLDEQ